MSSLKPAARRRDAWVAPFRRRGRGGFTLVELIVLAGIVVVLFSIFVPYVVKLREADRRGRCANNLRELSHALAAYANRNNHAYPNVVYDAEHLPDGYTAFTGADSPDPFGPGAKVKPNDVTASLWLLVRAGLAEPSAFVCPSSDATADVTFAGGGRVPAARRANFTSVGHLSYSYCNPFSSIVSYRQIFGPDRLPADFAVMADLNPGRNGKGSDVTAPAVDAAPFEMARANSRNHGRAGQNVLYADGHALFQSSPYCGVGRDNIYTALKPAPLPRDAIPPPTANGTAANGVCGNDVGPAWDKDSYLVPTEQE